MRANTTGANNTMFFEVWIRNGTYNYTLEFSERAQSPGVFDILGVRDGTFTVGTISEDRTYMTLLYCIFDRVHVFDVLVRLSDDETSQPERLSGAAEYEKAQEENVELEEVFEELYGKLRWYNATPRTSC